METLGRKPFQGIKNIIRFNWHFYVMAVIIVAGLFVLINLLPSTLSAFVSIAIWAILLSLFISIAVSLYVYDVSDLYRFDWLPSLPVTPDLNIVNINAGFDETSYLLAKKYPAATLRVLDFYDPKKHTEVSIKRARKVYPVYPGTETVNTSKLPLIVASADYIFCILSAHEIRNSKERTLFFEQLAKSLKGKGRIIVVEHLRDVPNLIAYNIGAFHFHSKMAWQQNFAEAGLIVAGTNHITPFITAFILQKNGTPS